VGKQKKMPKQLVPTKKKNIKKIHTWVKSTKIRKARGWEQKNENKQHNHNYNSMAQNQEHTIEQKEKRKEKFKGVEISPPPF